MKTRASSLGLTRTILALALSSAAGLAQPAQPSPPARINPATGLPLAAGENPPTPVIDPATGLPRSTSPAMANPAAPSWSLLEEARELVNSGKYEEGLRRYLAYSEQAPDPNRGAVLASALPGWMELAGLYPKARKALINIRDKDQREFVEGRGEAPLFGELASINKALGEEQASYALFKGIEAADTPLASHCYFYFESALVERGDYATCGRYFGDPQNRFESAQRVLGMQLALAEQQNQREQQRRQQLAEMRSTNQSAAAPPFLANSSATVQSVATNQFVRSITQLIEILVGTGRKPEAAKIQHLALAEMDTERLRSAISDAEARSAAARAAVVPMPVPIVIHPQFLEDTSLFPAELTPPSASVERWAPTLDRGVKPDLVAIRNEAKRLAQEGKYEDALQRHIWYHNHALEYEPEAERGVRLSFVLADWAALGRKYPKARQALLEIRDYDLQRFAIGRGSVEVFKDIASINEQWDYYRTTCALFHFVAEHNPQLAKRCYPLAESALVKNREYELCSTYVGDGQARFDEFRRDWERLGQWEGRMASIQHEAQKNMAEHLARQGRTMPPTPAPAGPPRAADRIMISNTRRLIEILVGAGHKPEADRIQEQALALLQHESLKSAVADAEEKLALVTK